MLKVCEGASVLKLTPLVSFNCAAAHTHFTRRCGVKERCGVGGGGDGSCGGSGEGDGGDDGGDKSGFGVRKGGGLSGCCGVDGVCCCWWWVFFLFLPIGTLCFPDSLP